LLKSFGLSGMREVILMMQLCRVDC